jgi:hypothetical protein
MDVPQIRGNFASNDGPSFSQTPAIAQAVTNIKSTPEGWFGAERPME